MDTSIKKCCWPPQQASKYKQVFCYYSGVSSPPSVTQYTQAYIQSQSVSVIKNLKFSSYYTRQTIILKI